MWPSRGCFYWYWYFLPHLNVAMTSTVAFINTDWIPCPAITILWLRAEGACKLFAIVEQKVKNVMRRIFHSNEKSSCKKLIILFCFLLSRWFQNKPIFSLQYSTHFIMRKGCMHSSEPLNFDYFVSKCQSILKEGIQTGVFLDEQIVIVEKLSFFLVQITKSWINWVNFLLENQ